MTRKTLRSKIQSRNNNLNSRQAQFALNSSQSKQVLSQYSPYLIVGIGLFAGIATRAIGWRRVYGLLGMGVRLYPVIMNQVEPSEE
ncbi:MAG: hypothetical protein ACI9OH_002368 [Oleispira sp.]